MKLEFIWGMTRFNIKIESNTTRSKSRIVLTMTGSKILASTPRHGRLQQDKKHFLVKLLRSCHLGVIG